MLPLLQAAAADHRLRPLPLLGLRLQRLLPGGAPIRIRMPHAIPPHPLPPLGPRRGIALRSSPGLNHAHTPSTLSTRGRGGGVPGGGGGGGFVGEGAGECYPVQHRVHRVGSMLETTLTLLGTAPILLGSLVGMEWARSDTGYVGQGWRDSGGRWVCVHYIWRSHACSACN